MEDLQSSFNKKKLQLRSNVIEFIVWLVLLLFCFQYLSTHPAEKTSIISWIEIMYQKVSIYISNILYWDGTIRKEKNELIRTYGDIIAQVEESQCDGVISKNLIEQKLEQLKNLSSDEYAIVKETYKMFISGQYLKIKELCGNK